MSDALYLPLGSPYQIVTLGGGTFALNGTTDAVEFIFQAVAAATITRLGFRVGTRTGTPPTYRISLQGVNASGNPDGTIKGGGTPASATFTPPASTAWNNSWQWVTLDNAYTCARGEYLAIVIDYSSGTIDGSNNITFATHCDSTSVFALFPFAIQNDAGVRTRRTGQPYFGYGSASKAYGNVYRSGGNNSISSAGEVAAKFTLPADWGDTFQVLGAHVLCAPISAGKTISMTLYEGGGAANTTVMQSVDWDTDFTSTTATGILTLYFDEATLSTLTFGSAYRLSFRTSDANIQLISAVTVNSAADWDASALGRQFSLSTRSGGNWTDNALNRLLVNLILADWTKPAGAGARLVGPSALVSLGGIA